MDATRQGLDSCHARLRIGEHIWPDALLGSTTAVHSYTTFSRDNCVLQVREYILIGEADGGICGEPETTWGQHWQASAQRHCAGGFEGFVRVDLPELSSLQICCTDERWQPRSNSRTVSFRRV